MYAARDEEGPPAGRAAPRGLDVESCQREVAKSLMICLVGTVVEETISNNNEYVLETESERVRACSSGARAGWCMHVASAAGGRSLPRAWPA